MENMWMSLFYGVLVDILAFAAMKEKNIDILSCECILMSVLFIIQCVYAYRFYTEKREKK